MTGSNEGADPGAPPAARCRPAARSGLSCASSARSVPGDCPGSESLLRDGRRHRRQRNGITRTAQVERGSLVLPGLLLSGIRLAEDQS